MFFRKVFIVSLLSACFALSSVSAAKCKNKKNSTNEQLNLCQELQLIRDLAPEASILTLVQSHMARDTRFRRAIDYMRSTEFRDVLAAIDATDTFQNILTELSDAGVDTTDIDSVGKIFDCVLMPVIDKAIDSRSSFRAGRTLETRSLASFAQEVAFLIPTNKLKNTLEDQLAKNEKFAAFYEVVRDPSFRTTVMNGLKNKDVYRSIKKLRHHQIDLSKMLVYAFNILNSGPEV